MKQDRSTVSRNSSFGISLRQAKHKPSEISMKEHINTDTLPFRSTMTYSYDCIHTQIKKRIQIGNVIWAPQLKRLRKRTKDNNVILTIQYSNTEMISIYKILFTLSAPLDTNIFCEKKKSNFRTSLTHFKGVCVKRDNILFLYRLP